MGKKESSGFQSFLGFELRAGGLCSAELGELWAQGVDWQQKIGWLWNKCSASSPAKAPLCVCVGWGRSGGLTDTRLAVAPSLPSQTSSFSQTNVSSLGSSHTI